MFTSILVGLSLAMGQTGPGRLPFWKDSPRWPAHAGLTPVEARPFGAVYFVQQPAPGVKDNAKNGNGKADAKKGNGKTRTDAKRTS